MIAISHNFSDLGQLGDSAVEQDHDFAVTRVEERQKVAVHRPIDDLSLRPLHWDRVGQLDKADLDLRTLAIELPLKVLPRASPMRGKVVFDSVGADGIENAPQTTVGVGRLDSPSGDLGGFLLAGPLSATHPRIFHGHTLK